MVYGRVPRLGPTDLYVHIYSFDGTTGPKSSPTRCSPSRLAMCTVPSRMSPGLRAYDFMFSFTTGVAQAANNAAAAARANGNEAASDPNGALSVPEALNRQLGLKLESVKRPEPVLVIDHIDEKPTEN